LWFGEPKCKFMSKVVHFFVFFSFFFSHCFFYPCCSILHKVKDIVVVFCEAFFITWPVHPSISSSIHGWHHTRKKTLTEINNSPPFAHVSLSRKGMPAPRGGTPKILISILVQTSRFSMARVPMNTCEMWYIKRVWKCSL
jgi:hypothetical protein